MPGKAKGHRLRLGRCSETGRIYLITAVCANRSPRFSSFAEGRCFVHAIQQVEDQAATLCYVVMPDHIHWLMQLEDGQDLSKSVQKVKSLTTRGLRARGTAPGRIWQPGFHDRALRREEDLHKVARYVVANPLQAGLVRSLREYPLWDAIWL
jgi:putative transposase